MDCLIFDRLKWFLLSDIKEINFYFPFSEREGIIPPVPETAEADRVRLTEAELEQFSVSNLHLEETEV